MGGERDFDFLLGQRWRVHNRVRRERLAGCDEWDTFDAELRDARAILHGFGNVDSFVAERDGQPFEAASIRIYDPRADEWHIYWADTASYRVTPQVVGRFESGVGELFGEEQLQGRPLRLRFRWTHTDTQRPRWEQAYLDPATGEWETNWVMQFEAA